jgi:alpha-D-ribose 1-methylphosphonate 5-triphosphate synthase subunit PhnH
MTFDRPGFADPAMESQVCFRAVLEATSRPGLIVTVGATLHPPEPLHRATAAVLLTLVDGGTPLWLTPALAASWDWVAFHCGAVAGPRNTAPFACAETGAMPALIGLHQGTDLEPEQSSTLVLQVTALGEGATYVLSGPGIEATTVLRVTGLPDDFLVQWAANGAAYPCGIDLVLCAGDRLCALPRTCRVEED